MAELAALLFGLMSECLFELRLGLLHMVLEVFFSYFIGLTFVGGGKERCAAFVFCLRIFVICYALDISLLVVHVYSPLPTKRYCSYSRWSFLLSPCCMLALSPQLLRMGLAIIFLSVVTYTSKL